MRRIAIMLAALVLVASGVTVAIGQFSPSESVYSAAEVQAGLRRNPDAWVGRVVLVRGSLATSGSSTVCASQTTRPRAVSASLCRPITTIGIGPSAPPAPVAGNMGPAAPSTPFLMNQARLLGRVHSLRPGSIVPRNSLRWTVWAYTFSSPTINLTVALRPGARLPTVRSYHPLPDFLYTLPLVGPQLAHWFPRDNGAIFRVRLNRSPNCRSPGASVTCDDTDGVLLSS